MQPSNATRQQKRHEVVAATWAYAPLALLISEYYDWQFGYRYHLNTRFALRAAYQTHGFTGRFGNNKFVKEMWEVKIPKSAQYALSTKPFHGFVSAAVSTPIYTGVQSGSVYTKSDGVGFGWGVGVGVEAVVKDKFTFAVFTEPMFSYIPLSNAVSDANNSSTNTTIKQEVYGDILSFSVGFCF